MKHWIKLILAGGAATIGLNSSAPADTIVYDNLTTAATAGYSQPNTNNPIYGDSLNLTQGGQLSIFGFSVYNGSAGGNTGTILTGNLVADFYDNTTPYSGGAITGALLGSASISLNFGASGLPEGFYSTATTDLTSLNINLPQNILVTQQFTETSGTSTANGVVLFSNPDVGSSPNTVFIESSATAENLYTFGSNPGQFGYQIQIVPVPEPSTLALSSLGAAALLIFGRRKWPNGSTEPLN